MNKYSFKDISLKGRVSFAIRCFENTLLSLNYNINEWKMVLEYLWEFTSIEYLDDWEDIMCDIIPSFILESKNYEDQDVTVIDENQFKYLYNLYQNIDEKVDYVMTAVYYIGRSHAYSRIVGCGQESLHEVEKLINYMVENNIPLPDIKPFEKFSIKENNGWGNRFDGKSISIIL